MMPPSMMPPTFAEVRAIVPATRRNENTFLGSGRATYEHIFYELRLDHESILSRSGRAADSREERNDIQTAGREGEGLFFLIPVIPSSF
jgi:hypothetical protein